MKNEKIYKIQIEICPRGFANEWLEDTLYGDEAFADRCVRAGDLLQADFDEEYTSGIARVSVRESRKNALPNPNRFGGWSERAEELFGCVWEDPRVADEI